MEMEKIQHQSTRIIIPWILLMLFFLTIAFNSIQSEKSVPIVLSKLVNSEVSEIPNQSNKCGDNLIIYLESEEKEEEKDVENPEYDATGAHQVSKKILSNFLVVNKFNYFLFYKIEKLPLYILYHCLKTNCISIFR